MSSLNNYTSYERIFNNAHQTNCDFDKAITEIEKHSDPVHTPHLTAMFERWMRPSSLLDESDKLELVQAHFKRLEISNEAFAKSYFYALRVGNIAGLELLGSLENRMSQISLNESEFVVATMNGHSKALDIFLQTSLAKKISFMPLITYLNKAALHGWTKGAKRVLTLPSFQKALVEEKRLPKIQGLFDRATFRNAQMLSLLVQDKQALKHVKLHKILERLCKPGTAKQRKEFLQTVDVSHFKKRELINIISQNINSDDKDLMQDLLTFAKPILNQDNLDNFFYTAQMIRAWNSIEAFFTSKVLPANFKPHPMISSRQDHEVTTDEELQKLLRILQKHADIIPVSLQKNFLGAILVSAIYYGHENAQQTLMIHNEFKNLSGDNMFSRERMNMVINAFIGAIVRNGKDDNPKYLLSLALTLHTSTYVSDSRIMESVLAIQHWLGVDSRREARFFKTYIQKLLDTMKHGNASYRTLFNRACAKGCRLLVAYLITYGKLDFLSPEDYGDAVEKSITSQQEPMTIYLLNHDAIKDKIPATTLNHILRSTPDLNARGLYPFVKERFVINLNSQFMEALKNIDPHTALRLIWRNKEHLTDSNLRRATELVNNGDRFPQGTITRLLQRELILGRTDPRPHEQLERQRPNSAPRPAAPVVPAPRRRSAEHVIVHNDGIGMIEVQGPDYDFSSDEDNASD
jgi:hypothetical protein